MVGATLFDMGGCKIIFTCVFQAERLLLNESDFFFLAHFEKNLAIQMIGGKPSRSNRVPH